MKTSFYITFVVLLLPLFISCDNPYDFHHKYFTRSFVMRYVQPDPFILQVGPGINGRKSDFIGFYLRGPVIFGESEGRERAKFDSLARANNDTTYNREVWVSNIDKTPMDGPSCLSENFSSIEVTTRTDFDAKHPAGTSINDLLEIRYRTYKPFVERGYQGKDSITVTTPLNELNYKELGLIYNYFIVLYFTKGPETPNEDVYQIFDVHVEFNPGHVCEESIAYNFKTKESLTGDELSALK